MPLSSLSSLSFDEDREDEPLGCAADESQCDTILDSFATKIEKMPSVGRAGIECWLAEPQRLRKPSLNQRLAAVVLILLPFPFVSEFGKTFCIYDMSANFVTALAFVAIELSKTDLSDRGRSFMQALRLAPTIYPLIFAGIVGRCLKTIARYQVERGATVEVICPSCKC